MVDVVAEEVEEVEVGMEATRVTVVVDSAGWPDGEAPKAATAEEVRVVDWAMEVVVMDEVVMAEVAKEVVALVGVARAAVAMVGMVGAAMRVVMVVTVALEAEVAVARAVVARAAANAGRWGS